MTVDDVLAELSRLGDAQTKKTLMRHGAVEPFYGVKIEHLKKIQKRIKRDHELALALYDTGVSDAMYLAGLICDPMQMKKSDLQRWVTNATWSMHSEYTVAWTAAESPHGWELGRKWIDSPKVPIATSGWGTLSSFVAITPDDELDFPELKRLLDRVAERMSTADNRVRLVMNGFVIACGCSVAPLTDKARQVARSLGVVEVDMGDTACKVPDALAYIEKVEARGSLGKKRKTAFC